MLAVVTTFIASHFSEICTSALDTNTGLRVGECAPHWSSITFIVLIVVAIYTLAVFFWQKNPNKHTLLQIVLATKE